MLLLWLLCRGRFLNIDPSGSYTVENRTWNEQSFDFDNFAQALLTILVLQTLDGWEKLVTSSVSLG